MRLGTFDFSVAYMFMSSLRFSEVFWVLFMRSKGLSLAAIGLLETVFHVASLLGEMPTGIIADRYGRKISLVVGRALSLISSIIVLVSKSWATLALGFAVQALSYTCQSGAFEALVYDNLPKEKRQDFAKIWGNLNSVYLVGTSLTAVSAGLIGSKSLSFLYILTMGADLIAMFAALLIREIPLDRSSKKPGQQRSLRDEFHSLAESLRRSDLRCLLTLWGIVSALTVSVKFYAQSLLKDWSIPLIVISTAKTTGNLLAIIATKNAYKLEERFGEVRSVFIGSLAVPIVILSMITLPSKIPWLFQGIAVTCYLSLTLIAETLYPLFSDAINTRIESQNRATVLSSGSMIFSLAMMVVFPTLGYIGDEVGLRLGIALAALGIVPAIFLLTMALKRNKEM